MDDCGRACDRVDFYFPGRWFLWWITCYSSTAKSSKPGSARVILTLDLVKKYDKDRQWNRLSGKFLLFLFAVHQNTINHKNQPYCHRAELRIVNAWISTDSHDIRSQG